MSLHTKKVLMRQLRGHGWARRRVWWQALASGGSGAGKPCNRFVGN